MRVQEFVHSLHRALCQREWLLCLPFQLHPARPFLRVRQQRAKQKYLHDVVSELHLLRMRGGELPDLHELLADLPGL